MIKIIYEKITQILKIIKDYIFRFIIIIKKKTVYNVCTSELNKYVSTFLLYLFSINFELNY